MEIKNMPGKLIIAAVFLFLCQALCAQEAGYYVDYIDGKPKFTQRLVWEGEEHALYYEVLIYVDNNGYREYSKNTTEDDLLLVSLPPGKYRYSVTPYDLLGISGEASEWKEFEVLPAFQPVLSGFTPEVFYLDRNLERVITISGDNFLEESEIFLFSNTDFLYPDEVTIVSGKSATLHFDDRKLVPGSYDIYITNPGGLSAQSGTFTIGYRKPLDFFLKLSWNPLIPVYGYMNEIIGPNVYLAGASLSFEAVSSKRGNFNGGLEMSVSFNYLNPAISIKTTEEYYPVSQADAEIFLTTFDLNIVLQRRFNLGQMALTFRFGVGVGTVSSSLGNYEEGDILIQLNLNATYLVRLYRDIYLEAGLDFCNHMSPVFSGLIKPRLGVVWQF